MEEGVKIKKTIYGLSLRLLQKLQIKKSGLFKSDQVKIQNLLLFQILN